MKKETKKELFIATSLLIFFAVWTVLVRFVDVLPIGPRGSSVGFAAFNGFVHEITGVHMSLYVITDWLGLVPIAVCLGFAVFGLVQWIKRKSILKVDKSIIALGVYYLIVMGVYILFEYVVINYRPVLINGYLEASYPSSTTMLVMCVMPTSLFHFNARIKSNRIRTSVSVIVTVFTAFMVLGRLISGVHWISDIIGGALFSAGILTIYYSLGRFELISKK